MNKGLLRSSLTLAAFLSLGVFAFAQHGPPAGGGPGMAGGGPGMGGPGMGGPPMGGPSMGRGPGMGSGNFGRPSDTGFPGANQNRMDHGMSNLGSQAPKRVLSNQKLDSSLTNALGKSGIKVPGGNLQTACAGFKNLGECVAAMHVAKNLNLSFSSLQNLMTGAHPESLGKAIRGLGGPNVKTRHELKKANKQTKRDLHAAAKAAAMTS